MTDPQPPQPTPFPIRIVQDPPGSDADDGEKAAQPQGEPKPRNDYFYPAWDKFLAIEPNRAKSTSAIVKATADERTEVAKTGPGEGLKVEQNASTSWEQAAKQCRAKVKAIVEECERLNQKYRDAIFDLETNEYCLKSLSGQYPKAVATYEAPPWIKRVEDIFDDPQFFIDGASATDVHQGRAGDCWFLAALMAVSAKKELIDRLCVERHEKAGVYGFVFYKDGEWIHEVIDDKLFLRVGDDDNLTVVRDWSKDEKEGLAIRTDEEKLRTGLQRGGEALYFSHCKSNETWLPLIEKAYAKAHGDYCAIEGGFPSEAIEDLTGGVGVSINPEDIMDKDRFWREQLSQVNVKYLFGGGSKTTDAKGVLSGHAYAVLEAFEEGDLKLLKLRNPWGRVEWTGDWSDGSKQWTPQIMTRLNHTFGDDGIFWMSYKDFLKHFPSVNRVRLFDRQWQVSQLWTSVNVPWTVDYLDTKFQFTIDQKAPVVIVLSQPDDRYFRALSGRFLFSLHFRVVSDREEDKWIVRSMHNSGNETLFTRSVSAEIEGLEPGTYSVLIKVTATRVAGATTAAEAIFDYAVSAKEKLLHVGRRFDYVQTKGDLRGLENANKVRAKQEERQRNLDGYRMARRYNMKVNARARARKQRIENKLNEIRAGILEQRQQARQRQKAEKEEVQPGAEEDKGDDEEDEESQKRDEEKGSADDEAEESDEEDSTEPEQEETKDQGLETDMSKVERGSKAGSQSEPPGVVSPIEQSEDEDEDQGPVELPELDDDDFEFDSDIDAPGEREEEEPHLSAMGKDNEIFAADPWNAMCVLGLRVYAKSTNVKIKVIKGGNDS